MANSLIKGLAITLGGGLAVGLGIRIGQSSALPAAPQEGVDFSPVLDRIEGVESRIVSVESAHAALAAITEAGPMVIPSVQELEERVQAHSSEVEALRAAIQCATEKRDARIDDLGYAVSNLEAKLPELIDLSIKPKFEELHDRVQREMQETASQTLEIFADRIQARVVEKITSIEGDLGRQSEAINDLRDYSLKTDQNLQRLLAGVENLADKINRKFEAPSDPHRPAPPQRPVSLPPSPQAPQTGGVLSAPPVSQPPVSPNQPASEERAEVKPVNPAAPPKPTNGASPARAQDFPARIELGEAPEVRPLRDPFPAPPPKSFSRPEFENLLADRPRSNGLRKAALAGGTLALVAAAFAGVELTGVLTKPTSAHTVNGKVAGPVTAGSADALDTKKLTDQSELLDQARIYSQKKELRKAEDVYRSILKTDPSNIEVKRLLASVLFRQEKIDESARIISSITEDKNNQGTSEGPQ